MHMCTHDIIFMLCCLSVCPSVCQPVFACVYMILLLSYGQVMLYKTLAGVYTMMGFRRKAAMMVHYAALQSFKLCRNYSHPQALFQVVNQ